MASVQELLLVQVGEGNGGLQGLGTRAKRPRQPQRGVDPIRGYEGEDTEDRAGI